MKRGIVALADGTVFEGISVGVEGISAGEVVFNTAMTGYQEILTDPSYAGQIITFTSPHIGNYGTSRKDDQSDTVHARAVIVRSLSRVASSWRSDMPLTNYLAAHNTVAVSDVDTRRLTRHIRESGAMSAAIGSDVDSRELIDIARATPSMSGLDLVSSVTTSEAYVTETAEERRGHVVAYDFGIKRDIIAAFTSRGFDVTVVPADATANDTLALAPDGVFLSNGPGDPEPLSQPIEAIRGLLGEVPVFGICLGHQLLALALGARTYKLPFGHHGGNHPVQRLSDGTVDITAQNHGFAVDLVTLSGSETPVRRGLADRTHIPTGIDSPFGLVDGTHHNLNDGTNEGLACRDIDAFSVQYHPEAAPGPNDARALFDRFVSTIGDFGAEAQ